MIFLSFFYLIVLTEPPTPAALLVFSLTLITPAQRRAGNPLVRMSLVY